MSFARAQQRDSFKSSGNNSRSYAACHSVGEAAMSEDKGAVLAAMDVAAKEAEKDLATLDQAAVEAVAAWWSKWYMAAGHKRLGRLLVKIAKSAANK
jgi:hypothetical protein